MLIKQFLIQQSNLRSSLYSAEAANRSCVLCVLRPPEHQPPAGRRTIIRRNLHPPMLQIHLPPDFFLSLTISKTGIFKVEVLLT